MDHPSYHRPGNPYGDIFGAFVDNQAWCLIISVSYELNELLVKLFYLLTGHCFLLLTFFVPSFFWLSSFGSLYFVTQHVKLPWCFHWEGSLMERNVCSLSTIGMQALYQCMWFACQLFHFSTICLFVSFLSIVCSVVSPYYIFSVFLPLMHMGVAGLSLAHGLNFSLVYKFITCSIIFFSAEF